MKKILIVLLLIMSNFCISQNNLYVSDIIEPYFVEFVSEAAKRNLFIMDNIMAEADYLIVLDGLPPERLGGVDRTKTTVFIQYGLTDIEYRLTVFHELTHLITNDDHTCDNCTDIMASYMYDTSYFSDEKIWKIELDKLFLYISKNVRR